MVSFLFSITNTNMYTDAKKFHNLTGIMHADATYILIWNRWPVLIVGTTDADKKFHPFGIQVSKNERTAEI